LFARDLYGIHQNSARDIWFALIKTEMTPSGRVEISTRASVRTNPSDDGSFSVSYLVTASGFYSIKGTLTQAGGLLATFYNSRLLQMTPSFNISSGKVLARVPPVVCSFVHWESIAAPPADACFRPELAGFSHMSAKFAGFIQPLFSETYTLSLISSESVRLYVDGLKILNKTSAVARDIYQVDGTIAFQAMTLYPVLVEFVREGSTNVSIALKWKSRSQILEVLPSDRM
jgi:hypothetical protein